MNDITANDTDKRNWRSHAPSWAVSIGLHALLLVLAGLITWTVTRPQPPDARLILEPLAFTDEAVESGGATGGGESESHDPQTGETDAVPLANQAIAVPPMPQQIPLPSVPLQDVQPSNTLAADPAMALLNMKAEPISTPDSRAAPGPGLLEGVSGEFRGMVAGLRGMGLDVVFVLDATISMASFIEQAKQRLHDVVGVINGLLQTDAKAANTRFGVVAFKDYGDEYGLDATIFQPLTNDEAAIRLFIDRLVAGGGADEPEPINQALRVATDARTIGWQRNRRSIIVLVTDAPVHSMGRTDALNQARSFVTRMKGTINVIDIGVSPDPVSPANPPIIRNTVLGDLQQIAEAGEGSAFLLKDEKSFWRHLIVSVFGNRYERDVQKIVEKYAGDE